MPHFHTVSMSARAPFHLPVRVLLVAFVAVLLLGGGIALAATRHGGASPRRSSPSRYHIDIQAIFDGRGNPALVANFSPNGGLATPRWLVCPPAHPAICGPARTDGQFLKAGPTPAGTVFEARASYRGKVYLARTATWLGTVRAVSPPTLTGRARYGATVTPHPGRWSGGWQPVPGYRPPPGDSTGGRGPSTDDLNVEACRTPTAARCVNLTPQGAVLPYGTRPPVIGAAITGRYLFAFDQRFAPDVAFAGGGYSPAAAVGVVDPGPTIARSAALGPIKGPPRPRVAILHHALIRRRRVLVARLRCSVRCHVLLDVSDRRLNATGHATVTGDALVGVPARALGRGRLKVEIYVGDGPPITGITHLR